MWRHTFLNPVSVVHKIDRYSPFYDVSAQEVLQSELEIVVVIAGIIESTGRPIQAISSYTSQEILWGCRFIEVISYDKLKQGFVKDFSKFDGMYRVNTPLCRAKELDQYYENRRRATSLLTWLKINIRICITRLLIKMSLDWDVDLILAPISLVPLRLYTLFS